MFFVIVGVELQMFCPGVGPQDVDLIQYTDQERAESSPEVVLARKRGKNQNPKFKCPRKDKIQKAEQALFKAHFDFDVLAFP